MLFLKQFIFFSFFLRNNAFSTLKRKSSNIHIFCSKKDIDILVKYKIPVSKKQAKPYLLKLQKDKCLMCKSKFGPVVPHEIHHIDHNSKNNVFSNFAALCSNCHAGIHRYNIPFPINDYIKILSNKNTSNILLKFIDNKKYREKFKKIKM